MAVVAPVSKSVAANPVAFAAAAEAGDKFLNTSGTALLIVRNAGASPATLTIASTQTISGLALPNRAIVVGAGATHVLGPFPGTVHNDPEGFVNLTYSDHEDITIAVVA